MYFCAKRRGMVPFINAVILLGTQINYYNELVQLSGLQGDDSRLCHIYLGMGGLALRGSGTRACVQLSCSFPCLQDAINTHVYT